jgi:hypothetical protein
MKTGIPGFVCAECGHPFDRRDTGKKHVLKLHQGKGNIVSFMEYILGVVNAHFPWPSYNTAKTPGPKSRHTQDSSSKTLLNPFFERIHQLAQNVRDFREITSFMEDQKGKVVPQNPPNEYLFGEACSNCLTVFLDFSPNLSRVERHQCEPKPPDFRSPEESRRLMLMIYSRLPISLKGALDRWIPGQKYLQAFCLTEGADQSYPSYIQRVQYQAVKNDAGNDYISRAIGTSSDPATIWAPVSDDEVLDLLGKAHGSVLLVEIQMRSSVWYEVRIVPPHYVWTRMNEQQNEPQKQIRRMMQEQMFQNIQRFMKQQQEQSNRIARENNQDNSSDKLK